MRTATKQSRVMPHAGQSWGFQVFPLGFQGEGFGREQQLFRDNYSRAYILYTIYIISMYFLLYNDRMLDQSLSATMGKRSQGTIRK